MIVGKSCSRCGLIKPHDMFVKSLVTKDRRGPHCQIATIAQMRSRAWGLVLVELSKCDLVCANCHRIRTRNRRRDPVALLEVAV